MANEEIELADDESSESSAAKGGTPVAKIAIIAVAGVLVLSGSVGATLYLTSGHGPTDTRQAQSKQAEADDAKQDAPEGEAIYLPLDPPITVSLDSDASRKYLQVSMSAMSRSDKVIDAIRKHRPAIRNNLNFLFSGLKFSDLATREGKEQIREAAREEIRKILEENGEASEVEALYFTNLVID